ncbi:MAG TPA: hypothetical protein VLA95_04930 [Gemmatimonadales bacterium]|nr:hypothetical protein [Gemmatimonadales bacterium]
MPRPAHRMSVFWFALALGLTGALSKRAAAQQPPAPTPRQPPCSAPEHRQLDFWVGRWELTWADTLRGTNVIEQSLDGCTIIERFDGRPSIPLQGMSVSAFDRRTGKWRQVWTDNGGGWIPLEGGLVDGAMVLETRAVLNGRPTIQRMRWLNVTADSLDWVWDASVDDGRTWRPGWRIHYRRAAP